MALYYCTSRNTAKWSFTPLSVLYEESKPYREDEGMGLRFFVCLYKIIHFIYPHFIES